jgi:hypothetical protein
VHRFWLSHKDKHPWLEVSIGGVHGWSWSSMAGHGGARRRGEIGGREGVGGAGRHGE